MAPQAQLEESANDRSKPERGGVGTFYSRYKIMQWGLGKGVRNVPSENKIFQRLKEEVQNIHTQVGKCTLPNLCSKRVDGITSAQNQ